MKLYILKNGIGTGDMPKELMVPKTGVVDPEDLFIAPITTYLIDHPEGKILYDTGMSRHFPSTSWELQEDEKMLNSLAKIGVSTDDIKYVVCSHLHVDHSGNLEYFTNSEIIVNDIEFTEVAKSYFLNKLPHGYVKADMDNWFRLGLNWKLTEYSDEPIKLMDGVSLITFGLGHTFGMLGLLIELPKTGNIMLVSDSIYCSENLSLPIIPPTLNLDKEGYIKNINRIQELAKKYHAQIWYGHDIDQYSKLIDPVQGYYD